MRTVAFLTILASGTAVAQDAPSRYERADEPIRYERGEPIRRERGEPTRYERANEPTSRTSRGRGVTPGVWRPPIRPVRRVGTARPVITPILPARRGSDLHSRFFEISFDLVGGDHLNIEDAPAPDALTPRLVDACDPSRYFVHLPARSFEAGLSDAQIGQIQARLDGVAADWWFAEEQPVDGVLPIRRAAAPYVINALRDVLGATLGDRESPLVGRVCSFASQCDPENPPPAFESRRPWHLERIQHSADLPQPDRGAVNIALIDSGIDTTIVAGTEHDTGLSDGDRVHGTYMGLLLRQVASAPNVHLRSYSVLGANNTATHHDLARVLDQAIFGADVPVDQPLVVNLSLGWPPELGQRRVLSASGPHPIDNVAAVEDGIGGAVRAVLDEARRLDFIEARKISVLAAAGNRPDAPQVGPALREDFGAPDLYEDPCYGKTRRPFQLFFPAEWSATPECDIVDEPLYSTTVVDNQRHLTWAVSASDVADAPGYVSIADEDWEPHFVAPGEQVLVDSEEAPAIDIELPGVISGTSVSTALVSGIAAYAQSLCVSGAVAGCPDGLSRWQLGQVLYHSGRALGRTSFPANAQMTVPDMCGVTAALQCDADVLSCIGPFADERSRIRSRMNCQDGRDQTVAEVFEACTLSCQTRMRSSQPPQTTAAFDDWLMCTSDDRYAVDRPEICNEDGLCRAHTIIVDGERHRVSGHASVGDVGPQPGFPYCPTCSFKALPGDGKLHGFVRLEGGMPPMATLTAAALELVHSDGTSEAFTVPSTQLSKLADGRFQWIRASGLAPRSAYQWKKSKGVFRMRFRTSFFGVEYDKVAVVPLKVGL